MNIFDFRLLSFIGIKKTPKAPWKKYYTKDDMKINVRDENIYSFMKRKIRDNDCIDNTAINYFGNKITYRAFIKKIDDCASRFINIGVKKYDIVTIISANVPEALISFYALNKIGAVVNILHPMLSENEIKDALNLYETKYLIVLDIVVPKINKILNDTKVNKVIVINPSNSMKILMKVLYNVKTIKKNYKYILSSRYLSWNKFMKTSIKYTNYSKVALKDDPALILQSGGSTGTPKGIVLSNGNINASTISAMKAYPDLCKEDRILGIMPIFHGFGLEVSINDAFSVGAEVTLIPTFKKSKFHELLIKHKPTVIVGVPTLFEALTTNTHMDNVDLSNLKYVISGGDTLNKERVENINDFLHRHNAKTNMIQGYGLTEAVAAASVDLRDKSRPGTIGIPWPGIYIGIFKPNTDKELDYDTDGEICICGPTVMLGYYNNEAETNLALKHHRDGNIWLHTGDIGSMDKDGFITYKQRLKRMIVTSGYNVYPSQIEEVLLKCDKVLNATVIGIPHKYKVEVPKAYVVLKKGYHNKVEIKKELVKLCMENLASYAIPKEIEFMDSLPKTIVGKVDFNKLKEDNIRMEKKNNEK